MLLISLVEYELTLLKLQSEGLLDTKLEDPYTRQLISNTNVVRITKDGNTYVYTYMGDECK